jgi:superfamily II DNA or RNA helicase
MIQINFSGKKKDNLQMTGDTSIISLTREFFSVPNPAYRSNVPYITSRLYCITPGGKFEIGLLKEVISFLEKHHHPFSVEPEVYKYFQPGFNIFDTEKLKIPFRDYQEKAILTSINQGRGMIILPTASGKTLVMAGLIKNIVNLLNKPNSKIMVVVPSIQLVEQTCGDFLNYGLENVTKWSGNNKPDFSKNIIVAGTQILLSKSSDLSILSDIDLFLCDEAHGIRRGNNINKIFSLIKTPHLYGFTGTMPPSLIDQWNIIGKFGPINYEEKTVDLKNQTYISNFQIIILKLKHPFKPTFNDFSNPTLPYQEELEFLINSDYRNNIIANLALKMPNNTIIMADRIQHGVLLEAKLREIDKTGRRIFFIQGSTEMEDRESIRKIMNDNNDIIVIAISKIFSTGINIPNLHNVIFGSAGKAKIKIMQSIGRALRLHPTKKAANIFDIADDTKYGKIHLKERKKLYEQEKYKVTEKEI